MRKREIVTRTGTLCCGWNPNSIRPQPGYNCLILKPEARLHHSSSLHAQNEIHMYQLSLALLISIFATTASAADTPTLIPQTQPANISNKKQPPAFQPMTIDQRRQLATANSREAQDALMIKWGMKTLDDPNGSLATTIDKYESATSDKERAALASTIKTYYYVSNSDDERQMIRQVFVDHPAATEVATTTASPSSGASRAPASVTNR